MTDKPSDGDVEKAYEIICEFLVRVDDAVWFDKMKERVSQALHAARQEERERIYNYLMERETRKF